VIALRISKPFYERPLLERIAQEDLRTLEQAIRWLIRQEAERRGYIKPGQSILAAIQDLEPELEQAHE
jgi:hypothetical protein